MLRNLDNCFYCQELKKQVSLRKIRTRVLTGGSLCNFCGAYNDPLWWITYQKRKRFFCCSCAWWQFPRSEEEKEAEAKWYKEWKNQ